MVMSNTFAQNFSANCESGSVMANNCTVSGGIIQNPSSWWTSGYLWRVGVALTVNFTLSGDIPNFININVKHTGSTGENEYTLGQIKVNNNTILTSYVPPYHMYNADTFTIPRAYLQNGINSIVISLSGGSKVWWIRSIEAIW